MNRSDSVIETRALLLRRVEFGEADLVLTLFTQSLGRISALARGARRSRKRFAGALEPFFTLNLRLQPPGRGELFTLLEATIVNARTRLLSDLERMNAAGRALNWLRRTAPAHTQDANLWQLSESFLDRLTDLPAAQSTAEIELARTGLRLLTVLGFGLELGRCVRCGRPCPPEKAGSLDVASGGLVCRACGGARKRLTAQARAELIGAAAGTTDLSPTTASIALELVEAVLTQHAGLES